MDHPASPAYPGRHYIQQVEGGQDHESLKHLDVEAQPDHEGANYQPAQPTGLDGEYESPSP
jgi:hypothetical protein